jgi:DNA-binding MarR family transcriptional regulator
MREGDFDTYFRFFNEIGIIEQLSRSLLEARLPPGFILPHFAVLNHLVRVKDGQPPLALARAFQVPKTTMTHTLLALERAALVEVRPNPRDGRSKLVWITGRGQDFREAAISAIKPDLARIAASVPVDRVSAVLPALEEVRRFLDADRDGTAGSPGAGPRRH